jgi:DNA-binding NarL/FixJ family response regulator
MNATTSHIAVFIVEDDETIRESLSILLGGTSGFKCVGSSHSAEQALVDIPKACPDVVLMDINLVKLSGIDCVAQLRPILSATQFIMLTAFSDDALIFDALAAGATGYLLKRTPPSEILEAIEEVHRGGSPMSGQIARRVVQSFRSPPVSAAPVKEMASLSPRENEILEYLSKGYRYKEIASQLNISTETVRTHLRRIYEKLQVRSGTEAVARYLKD